MTLRSVLAGGLLACCFCLPASAMELGEAMSALAAAKQGGQVGEQPDGYLGAVTGQGADIARVINQARRAEYQRLAKDNGLQLGDVEALAGQKALEKTPAGQYIQVNGKWVRK